MTKTYFVTLVSLVFFMLSSSDLNAANSKEHLRRKGFEIRSEKLPRHFENLKKYHQKMKPVQAGDWLERHAEKGQSYRDFLRRKRIRPDGVRKYIYIQVIGDFSEQQAEVLRITKSYMKLCFGVNVKSLSPISLSQIPKSAKRIHPSWGVQQLYTGYLMDKVLKKRKRKDALCLIGFTATDLYPDPDWNFVFGIARPSWGLGLWSIYRNGDPSEGEESFKLCLRRTIQTAIHEAAHIFAIKHCIAYSCVMNGSNSREESDRREVHFCPSCLHKLCKTMKISSVNRFKKLKALCLKYGLDKEAEFFAKCLDEK